MHKARAVVHQHLLLRGENVSLWRRSRRLGGERKRRTRQAHLVLLGGANVRVGAQENVVLLRDALVLAGGVAGAIAGVALLQRLLCGVQKQMLLVCDEKRAG